MRRTHPIGRLALSVLLGSLLAAAGASAGEAAAAPEGEAHRPPCAKTYGTQIHPAGIYAVGTHYHEPGHRVYHARGRVIAPLAPHPHPGPYGGSGSAFLGPAAWGFPVIVDLRD